MKKLAMTALVAGIAFSGMSVWAADFVAGKDYQELANPEKIEGNKIIVREFFWYGCPHCYNLEPYMQKWAKTKPSDVVFMQTPAAMNPVWEQNARGFYTAQLMGIQHKTHQAMFDALQKDRQKLYDQASIGKWYEAQGADLNKFNSLYNSFAVNTKIARAQDAAKRYQISGVPAVVVDGKYVVSGEDDKVTQVVDFLVKKSRSERGGK
ncbi:DSBA oxidoreductase [Moraxella macacae 0408225]|uniref:Thiol:disulfide interchange protein n=1 Tax=Moraxella macacae 0408225 TaxID=1230338 RepID=L2F9F8_9GAMM|nr:thiol:disulfide interchange protein DsbA/DsbL [Moraxella macacae]ELA09088.1 DSBA oxidoreductase [Moraxella macacae 0408225]